MNNKYFSILKLIIGWPISIIAIIFVVKLFLPQYLTIITNIKNINPIPLILGIICFLLFYFLRSFLWKMLLFEKGHDIPFKESSFLWGISELKRFVPGNIWSFLGKGTTLTQRGIEKATIAHILLLEAEFFLVGCVIISIISVPFILQNVLSIRQYPFFIVPVISIIILVISLTFIFSKKLIIKNNKTFYLIFNNILPTYSPLINFKLLFISMLSLFCFGFGTYFTIVSFTFLDLSLVLQFIGFFVFSLLMGYISFITPMGLGVREGVITTGLSKTLILQTAGFAAIYARFTLIFSEIIFLLLSYIWKNVKNTFFIKVENFIKNHFHEVILGILIFLYIFYFTTASFQRHDNFYTGRFDLGNMDQTVWSTIHGRIFEFTNPNGTNIISRLAFHADFILILLSPLYLIWSNPKMLLFLQSAVLGFGAFFVYLLALNTLKNKNLSLILSFAFLINPLVNYVNLYDFHPVALATTFLLGTFYFLRQKKYLLFLLFLTLSVLTKEQIWIIAGLFGMYIFFINKKRLLGAGITILSLTIFYYLIWHAIPTALGGNHFALVYYSDFGESPASIIKNVIFSPLKTLSIILQEKQLSYLISIFLPLGFLSFLNPLILIFAVPDLLINLLSGNPHLHEIYYQYSSAIIPFVFISSIYGIYNLKKWFQKINVNIFTYYILCSSLIMAYVLGPLPGSSNPNVNMFIRNQPNKKAIENFLSSIPQKFSIAATNNLGSHLSQREKIYTIPVGIDQADIVLFLLNDPFAQPSLAAQIKMAKKMSNDKNYIEIFRMNDFIVFEKRNLYLESGLKKINQVKLFPLSIPSLSNRNYEGGAINTEEQLNSSDLFSSFIISYPSDGLKIYALLNIPNDKKPKNGFPVLIINHGYINPKNYSTVNSYKTITDYFSSNGFLVIKPDYRGNANSKIDNKDLMRFAYPIDVMNLITSIKNIQEADRKNIYLWGHSMGGEVTLKVLEIIGKNEQLNTKIKAAVLWAPVTDPLKWFSKKHLPTLVESHITPYPYTKTFQILGTPDQNPLLWQSLSPLSYLSEIKIPLQINHGKEDETVPYEWSIELYNKLKSLDKNVQLNSYPNSNHNLSPLWNEASENSLKFFRDN